MITIKYRILAWSLSILLIALPLNTLLVQLLVVKLGLPVGIALWKEVLASIVMVICVWEMYRSEKLKLKSQKWIYSAWLKTFLPLILVGLMTLIGIIVSIGKVNLSYFIYGFRFELFWVWFWVILAVWGKEELPASNVPTPQEGISRSLSSVIALLAGFLLSSFFSIIIIIFGAQNTLGWLGYGQKATQSGAEFLFTQPLGHLIDAGGWNSDFRL